MAATEMPAWAATRWRSMARLTVERPTPKSSATSRVLYSPLCTRETRWASCLRLSLGCLPRSRPLGLGDLHALDGAKSDQVGLELRDHRENVEQQPTDRVGRVIDRAAQAQADLPGGEFVGDRPRIGQRPRQTVKLGDHQGVTCPACGHSLAEPGALPVGAGQAGIDVDELGLDPEAEQGVALSGQILLIGGASGVPDKQCAHHAPPGKWVRSSRKTQPTRTSV